MYTFSLPTHTILEDIGRRIKGGGGEAGNGDWVNGVGAPRVVGKLEI